MFFRICSHTCNTRKHDVKSLKNYMYRSCAVRRLFVVEGSVSPTEVYPGETVTYTLQMSNFEFDAFNLVIGPFIRPPMTRKSVVDNIDTELVGYQDAYIKVPFMAKDSSKTVQYYAVANEDTETFGKVAIFDGKSDIGAGGVCAAYSRSEEDEAYLTATCTALLFKLCPPPLIFDCKVVINSKFTKGAVRSKDPSDNSSALKFFFHPDKLWSMDLKDMLSIRDIKYNRTHDEWKASTRIFIDPDNRQPALPALSQPVRGYPFKDVSKIQNIITRRRCGMHRF